MQWLRNLPLHFKIASVGGLVILLMLLALTFSTSSVNALTASQKEQQVTVEVVHHIEQLLTDLVDMETGVRGYVIAGNREFLEPFEVGMMQHSEHLTQLEELMSDDSSQLDRLARIRTLIGRWHDEVLLPEIALVEGQQKEAAVAMVQSKAGKAIMDQIRSLIGEVNAVKQRQAADLAAQVTRTAEQSRNRTFGAALGAVLLSTLAAYALARSITRPILGLMDAAEQVATGGAGYQVPVGAQDEVGRLATAFNRMSDSLMHQQVEMSAQNEELHAQQEMLTHTMAQLERDSDRLRRLNQFSRSMVSTDIPSLSRRLLADLLAASGAQVGALALLDSTGDLKIQAQVGLTEAAAAAPRVTGLFQEALTADEPLAVTYPNGALLRPVYHTDLPVEHELYVPIRFGGETLAVAALGRTGPAPFPQEDIHWLTIMAAQAAATLSNTLGYEKLSEAFTDLQDSAAHIEELSAQIEEERDRVRAQRDNLRAILQSTSEGVCLVSLSGLPILVNDQFWHLFGADSRQELTMDELGELIRPRLKHPKAAGSFIQAMLSQTTSTDVLEFAEPEYRVLHRFTTPVFAEDGKLLGSLFVLRDVTREAEIDRMKTEFISTVSHELRTPLTAIRGYVDLILDGDVGPISDEQREFLDLVSRSTVRLANLINDLLDVEKIEQGRIHIRQEEVNAAALLRDVVETFRVSAADKGLTCDVTVEGALPPVYGDPDRITQVFSNLLSNAVKYTKAGGITIRAAADADRLTFTFADTGIGVAPDHLPSLFEKFYRVDNQYTREVGGTGLGLAITKAIVEHHGGTIEVQSEVGTGTTFVVTLPAHRGITSPSAGNPAHS
ncbi:MAG: two-component sensor histidine kinase [Symbiobacteriaceae bacterium]|jgi:signal transduction histidine kinase|nr:two-component sensor histidine kinase [Symbiobacteriaceae bacterium]